MSEIKRDVWENSKRGDGPCEGCPNAKGKYNHPGFFDPKADILVVEEVPSKNHFNFPNYDRSNDADWYTQYFEVTNRDSILGWPPIELFLGPVFEEFGYSKEDIPDLVFMTSAVKCPDGNLDESYEHCRTYLERRISEMEPTVIISAGKKPTKWTARLLGVPASDTRAVRISKREWWGLSDFFDTEPPLIHVPHWGYYNTHHQLTDEEWEDVIRATQSGLEATYFE